MPKRFTIELHDQHHCLGSFSNRHLKHASGHVSVRPDIITRAIKGNIMTSVLNLLSAHRSIRKFTAKSVDETLLTSLISAAQCTSTSHHVQAYTIIQVTDLDTRQKIADMAGPQPWVAQAPVFLVFCADLTRLVHACRRHNAVPETGWAEQLPVGAVFHKDRFPSAPEHKALADYDQKIQAYYEKRSSTLIDRTWTRQMADFTGQVIRPHMKVFLEKKGFFRQ
jgi:hypothetical protein